MICKKCNSSINDNAKFCPVCGNKIEIHNEQQQTNIATIEKSKTFSGVILALFLGFIGLLIGIGLYDEGSYERKTFMKGWSTTFASVAIFTILFYIFSLVFL